MRNRSVSYAVMAALIVVTCGLKMAYPADRSDPPESEQRFVIAIHGGGGVRPRDDMTAELDAAYRDALDRN